MLSLADGGEAKRDATEMNFGDVTLKDKSIDSDWRGAVIRRAERVVDNPLYQAAQTVPGLNIPLSAAAYPVHVASGNTVDAALDATSMIPGFGLTVGAGRMIPRVYALTRGVLNASGARVGALAQVAQSGQAGYKLAETE